MRRPGSEASELRSSSGVLSIARFPRARDANSVRTRTSTRPTLVSGHGRLACRLSHTRSTIARDAPQ